MTPRELRVWHYRKVLSAEHALDGYAGQPYLSPLRRKALVRDITFHGHAVKVLDPFCDGYTAADDEATFPKPHSRFPKPKRTRCNPPS